MIRFVAVPGVFQSYTFLNLQWLCRPANILLQNPVKIVKKGIYQKRFYWHFVTHAESPTPTAGKDTSSLFQKHLAVFW